MNDLCAEIGYKSILHHGEQLCGDHVDIIEQEDGSTVVVLADGLGSGVKASILSTLTAKIISTMMAAGLTLEDCVETIAATLPVDNEKQVAYSTFTIMHIIGNETMELIQYDNPMVVMLRRGHSYSYPKREQNIGGKSIIRSSIKLMEGDMFIAMSDGCPYASIGVAYNQNWKPEDIVNFFEILSVAGYPAKTLSTMFIDECFKLYGEQPRDDATGVVIKIRKREPMNVLFGPPSNKDEAKTMMSLFFSKAGKHIVCGGSTAKMVGEYLEKTAHPIHSNEESDIPPISELEGTDLVTEGVITMTRVVEYARDYVGDNTLYETWSYKKDGASKISLMLFEEATDINFFVGQAINPAHQNPNLPNFNIKMKIVEELSECLRKMGKKVKVSYF